MVEGRHDFTILTEKPKVYLGMQRRRWEDNIEMDPKEIGLNTRNLVDSGQDRNYWGTLLNVALNLRVP